MVCKQFISIYDSRAIVFIKLTAALAQQLVDWIGGPIPVFVLFIFFYFFIFFGLSGINFITVSGVRVRVRVRVGSKVNISFAIYP